MNKNDNVKIIKERKEKVQQEIKKAEEKKNQLKEKLKKASTDKEKKAIEQEMKKIDSQVKKQVTIVHEAKNQETHIARTTRATMIKLVDRPTPTTTVKKEEHNWQPVYRDKWVGPEGHYEIIVDKEAWTETYDEPIYETKFACQVVATGEIFYNDSDACNEAAKKAEFGQTREWEADVQVGTRPQKIEHPAETHKKWVVTVKRHKERVIDHYVDTVTGETKQL